MKLTIIAHEKPYPPLHGGKLDTWNRIVGFSKLGLKIQLVYWYDKRPASEGEKKIILRYVDELIELKRTMGLLDLMHPKYPPRAMSCRLVGKKYRNLLTSVTKFGPQCIWLDLWYGYLTAKALATDTGAPLLYRSQNIEHHLFQRNYAVATGLLKLKLFLNLIRIKKTEYEIRSQCKAVYDISGEDLQVWKAIAPELESEILFPTWNRDVIVAAKPACTAPPDCDIIYIGNLGNAPNIAGLKWFVENPLKFLRDKVNYNLRVIFAGSTPSSSFKDFCTKNGIEVIADPADIISLYERAKIIINPHLEGSGISMKMIEVLCTTKPIVSTSSGVRGMPPEVKENFLIADDAKAFAEMLSSCLQKKANVDLKKRERDLELFFGLSPLREITKEIEAMIVTRQPVAI